MVELSPTLISKCDNFKKETFADGTRETDMGLPKELNISQSQSDSHDKFTKNTALVLHSC